MPGLPSIPQCRSGSLISWLGHFHRGEYRRPSPLLDGWAGPWWLVYPRRGQWHQGRGDWPDHADYSRSRLDDASRKNVRIPDTAKQFAFRVEFGEFKFSQKPIRETGVSNDLGIDEFLGGLHVARVCAGQY